MGGNSVSSGNVPTESKCASPGSSTSCWLAVDVVSRSGHGQSPRMVGEHHRRSLGHQHQVCLSALGC